MIRYLSIFFVFLVLFVPSISFGAAQELYTTPLYATSSMISYWRFESGSNATFGPYNGADTSMSYSTGKFGNAAIFNGSTSRISMTATTLTDFTISFWSKQNGTSGGSQVLQNFSNAGDNGNADSYIESSSNYLRGSLWNGSAGTNLASGVSVNDSIWHQWAMTRSGATLRVYLDGVERASSTSAQTVTIGNLWELGRNRPNNNSYCNCGLDDLAVFNVALDSATISQIYNGFPYNPTSTQPYQVVINSSQYGALVMVLLLVLVTYFIWTSRTKIS